MKDELNKKGKAKVSILCTTYNHGDYIEDALNSFLMQKTNFDFEVLINDDASTDRTTEIIQQYQKKYPNIFKLNIQSENLYSQGYRNMMGRFLLPKAKGQYIALCEGDDYWTDTTKLQKQVDFMEQNKDYTLCFHPVRVIFEDKNGEDYIFPEERNTNGFTLNNLLGRNFIQTNSVLYRRLKNYPPLDTNIIPSDWYLHVLHAKEGKIGYIDSPMSVYRRHSQGLWWDALNNKEKIWEKHGINHFALFVEFMKLFESDSKKKSIIQQSMAKLVSNLVKTDKGFNTILMGDVIERFPSYLSHTALGYQAIIDEKIAEIKTLTQRLDEKETAIERRDDEIHKLKELMGINKHKRSVE